MLLMLVAISSAIAGCYSQQAAETQQVPPVATWLNGLKTSHSRLLGHKDWQARGGALKVLGKRKLDRIRLRSALVSMDAAKLAARLNEDKELVSCSFPCCCPPVMVAQVLLLLLLLLLLPQDVRVAAKYCSALRMLKAGPFAS
jgi:hypothetical protein